MKTFFAVILLVSVIARSSSAQDTNVAPTSSAADAFRMSPSPLEIGLNCGIIVSNIYGCDPFHALVRFGHTRTNIAIEVTFRNVGEKEVWPKTYVRSLTIVWDGKEYKQTLLYRGWNETSLSSHDTARHFYFLSDFNIPPEARASGRHTVAVRDAYSELDASTLSTGFSPQGLWEQNKLIFAESSTMTVFITNPQ